MASTKIDSSNIVNTSSLLLNSLTNTKSDSNSTQSLTSSLLGSSSDDTSSQLFDVSKISKTASILALQKQSLSKLAVGVIDTANSVTAAQEGVAKGQTILKAIADLLKQAQDPTLTAEKRTEIKDKVKTQTDAYSKLITDTTYNEVKVLSENKITSVKINQSGRTQRIQMSNVSLQALGLGSLDATSAESAKKSSDAVSAALQNLTKVASRLQKSHEQLAGVADKYQKALQTIVKYGGSDEAADAAASTDTDKIQTAQNLISALQAEQLLL